MRARSSVSRTVLHMDGAEHRSYLRDHARAGSVSARLKNWSRVSTSWQKNTSMRSRQAAATR